ncbi:MAG: UDP-N-acetylmuramoyl-tripeptide--D-alanyl-D-alanine ligase, partial [candidate division Zixibacteria bacterium]|nr:UDP-N-acetylmuramoyl-tripeptide--D-alanyl-D-alanine ligase [candidate division Zixibacteria bacterium]
MRFDQLAEMTDGTLAGKNVSEHSFTGVSIDSRTIRQGELFVAIRGGRVDGHDYLAKALQRGAAGVMVERRCSLAPIVSSDTAVVSVTDSHEAMLSLATRWRDRCPAKVIGITGSNGKTTTKELTFGLLNAVEKGVYRSPGNFNNLYGAPLSIFGIDESTRVAILELGISTKDEMPKLAKLVHPDLILITNVGPSHLEFFGTVEAVAHAKLELARQASPDVPVVINADDALLVREATKLKRPLVTFGINAPADFVPERISPLSLGGSEVTIGGKQFRVPLIGLHHVSNLLAAYAATATLGYDFESIDTSTIAFATAPMRGQLVEKNGITFFNDAYNANPAS